MNNYEAKNFAFFRVSFGFALVYFFSSMIPWGIELYSEQGMLPDLSLSPLAFAIPKFSQSLLLSSNIQPLLIFASLAAVLLTIGFCRRIMALLLYLIFLLLTFRNPYNTHVATDYIGWMLLLCVIVPAGEACAVWPKQMPDWKMSRIIIFGAWLILAAGYCRSGYVKLSNPYWRDGTALLVILQNPFGGGAFLQQIFSSYPILCKLCTWSVLGLELLSLPLCFFRLGRWIVWTGMLAMHFGIFVLMAISTIPLVMGAFHVLTFPSWAQLAISGTTKKPNPQAH